jgi:hypothetical protein
MTNVSSRKSNASSIHPRKDAMKVRRAAVVTVSPFDKLRVTPFVALRQAQGDTVAVPPVRAS